MVSMVVDGRIGMSERKVRTDCCAEVAPGIAEVEHSRDRDRILGVALLGE